MFNKFVMLSCMPLYNTITLFKFESVYSKTTKFPILFLTMSIKKKVLYQSKQGFTIKDHSSDPLKNSFDDIYSSHGIGTLVEFELDSFKDKIVGIIENVVATRGCIGCVTYTVKDLNDQIHEISWRTQGMKSFKRLSLKDLKQTILKQ